LYTRTSQIKPIKIILSIIIKEYENRWYVIGVPKGMNEIRTLGLIEFQLLERNQI
jgi:hypothetical protein